MKRKKGKYPIKWNEDRPRQAFQLALLGATDEQIAEVMDVAPHTIDYWKRNMPPFLSALKEGKMKADARVAESFFKKALGYEREEYIYHMHRGKIIKTKIKKYYPPDSWAAKQWLALRQRTTWTEVQKTEHTQMNININKFDFSGLSDTELMIMKKAGLQQLPEHARSD